MSEFIPPISKRETEALIGIANSSTAHWQQKAIDEAKEELEKRGITQDEQNRVVQKWNIETEEYFKIEAERLEKNKTESYETWEMLVLFIFGPILFIRPFLFNSNTVFTLRGENYFLKFKQRILILGLSFIGWFFYMNYSFKKSEEKRLQEIDKIDISDWKKEHGFD